MVTLCIAALPASMLWYMATRPYPLEGPTTVVLWILSMLICLDLLWSLKRSSK